MTFGVKENFWEGKIMQLYARLILLSYLETASLTRTKFYNFAVYLIIVTSFCSHSFASEFEPPVRNEIIAVDGCVAEGTVWSFSMTKDQYDPKRTQGRWDRISVLSLKSSQLVSKAKLSKEKTIWRESTYKPIGTIPGAKIQYVIGSAFDCNKVYLFKSVASNDHLSIKIYSIQPDIESEVPIVTFDDGGHIKDVPESVEEKPVAIFEKDLIRGELCDNTARFLFSMLVEPRDILVSLQRNDDRCKPLYLRLNLQNNLWTEIEVTEKSEKLK
jgi:hypothetical protein